MIFQPSVYAFCVLNSYEHTSSRDLYNRFYSNACLQSLLYKIYTWSGNLHCEIMIPYCFKYHFCNHDLIYVVLRHSWSISASQLPAVIMVIISTLGVMHYILTYFALQRFLLLAWEKPPVWIPPLPRMKAYRNWQQLNKLCWFSGCVRNLKPRWGSKLYLQVPDNVYHNDVSSRCEKSN